MKKSKPTTKGQLRNLRNKGNRNQLRRKMIRMGVNQADFTTCEQPMVIDGNPFSGRHESKKEKT